MRSKEILFQWNDVQMVKRRGKLDIPVNLLAAVYQHTYIFVQLVQQSAVLRHKPKNVCSISILLAKGTAFFCMLFLKVHFLASRIQ